MLKALLLIILPGRTWDGIAESRRSFGFVAAFYLLPVMAISIGGECAGLLKWGSRQSSIVRTRIVPIPEHLAVGYGICQFIASLAVILMAAKMVQYASHTFHRRTTYAQCLVVMAYSLGPWFLVRLVDGYPLLNPWVTFAVGLVLSLGALYNGIPRVLNPDPPQAFGVFVASAFVLAFLCGLARLATLMVLTGKLHLPMPAVGALF